MSFGDHSLSPSTFSSDEPFTSDLVLFLTLQDDHTMENANILGLSLVDEPTMVNDIDIHNTLTVKHALVHANSSLLPLTVFLVEGLYSDINHDPLRLSLYNNLPYETLDYVINNVIFDLPFPNAPKLPSLLYHSEITIAINNEATIFSSPVITLVSLSCPVFTYDESQELKSFHDMDSDEDLYSEFTSYNNSIPSLLTDDNDNDGMTINNIFNYVDFPLLCSPTFSLTDNTSILDFNSDFNTYDHLDDGDQVMKNAHKEFLSYVCNWVDSMLVGFQDEIQLSIRYIFDDTLEEFIVDAYHCPLCSWSFWM